MSSCRSCGGEIRWAKTAHGRNMPLDADPAPDDVHAGFVLRDGGKLALSVTRDMTPGETLYLSHFATCPNADQHRRS